MTVLILVSTHPIESSNIYLMICGSRKTKNVVPYQLSHRTRRRLVNMGVNMVARTAGIDFRQVTVSPIAISTYASAYDNTRPFRRNC